MKDNLRVGGIVFLHDRDVPPSQWPFGMILRVFPSDDGLIREAELKVF